MDYAKHFSTTKTHQTQSIPGKPMAPNNAGGFGFKTNLMKQLDRFLILGTEGGTHYVTESKLTIDNASNVLNLIKKDGQAVVNRVVQISHEGRAPKNGPALFVLALCTAPQFADLETRRLAFKVLPEVARISTHLFEFIGYMQNFRGWGKLAQTGIQDWYQNKTPSTLEHQMVKYRQRLGWTHNDVLRLAKPVPASDLHNKLYEFAKKGVIDSDETHDFSLIEGFNKIQTVDTAKKAAKIVADYRLPMETVPTQFKKDPVVWEALLPHLPITATIRNLRNMARCKFLEPMSDTSKIVADRISDNEIIEKGRVHPIQFLNALLNYPVGAMREVSGMNVFIDSKNAWSVAPNVVKALNSGFHSSFKTVKPSGKRIVLALDVSGSMAWYWCLGMQGVTPREASAALCLITANVEDNHLIGIFQDKFTPFTGIKADMHIDDAVKAISNIKFGATNIASPITWAMEQKLPVDAISCYTDNETYCGGIHPCQALEEYKDSMGIDTKFISVSMCANNITVADPSNKNMLDIIGFDTTTPKIISEFANM